jgi:hypothetical protein
MNETRPDFLTDSLIVAAHADDEVLWFSSILPQVDEVIVVYRDFWAQPQIGAQRTAALAAHPHPNVTCLNVDESGSYGCADWANPTLTDDGIALGLEADRRAATRLARKSIARVARRNGVVAAETVARAYAANASVIREALRPRLHAGMNVFTHNPWGEYGHEEHIQVFRVLEQLREEIGFRLWMSNYCTERSLPLAMRYFVQAPGRYLRLPSDKVFAEKVADCYKRAGCWTWADDWAWFDEECFMEAPRSADNAQPHRHLFPLNLFTIDGDRQKNWLPLALTMSVASAAIGATLMEAI